jgi:ATP-dependent Clp protease ATP-binding subunit ClpB
MRQDKLTTKFQEALGDAQSLALGNDNAYIEPAHLLVAMLRQDDGPRALLERAGVNVPGLTQAAEAAIKKLPQVQGHDIVQVGPELSKLLQATEKESIKRNDQFIAGELFLLALADSKADIGKTARENGLSRKSLEAAIDAVRGGQGVNSADAEGQREALKKYTLDLTERARLGKLDPVIGRDEEIPAWARPPSSKAWRSASCRARCPIRSRASACCRSTWPRCSPAPSSAASSRSA